MDGEKDVTIPAGIQHGEYVKIRGAGIPNLSKPSVRGDHIVVVSVKVPTHISNEEKLLYTKLNEIQKNRENNPTPTERIKGMFK